MKRLSISYIFLFLAILTTSAQNIIVFGEGNGKNTETAVRNALKSALEQAYGTFISSDTEIFNDEVVADDIVSLQYGNVQSYKIISESGDSVKHVFVEAVINRDRLAQYVHNKGLQAELEGNLLAMNVKLASFNLENMERTLIKLIKYLVLLSESIYDYQLEIAEPVLDDSQVYIPVAVKSYLNKNAYSFFKTSNDVCQAVIKACKSNQIRGNLPENALERIDTYIAFLPHLQRLACYNFKLSDNIGNMVRPYFTDTIIAGHRPSDIITFSGGYLKATGIDITPLNEAEKSYPVLIDYIHAIKLRWNLNPYNYYFYLIDNLNEVPYSSTRNMRDNTAWFSERLENYPQKMQPGIVNGTVRMVLVYNINQIAKLNTIEVEPDRTDSQ